MIEQVHLGELYKLPAALKPYRVELCRISLTARSAVYILMKGGRAMYVGQSQNVIGRIAAHLQKRVYDEILYIPTPVENLNALERELISGLNPPLNKNSGLVANETPYRLRHANAALAVPRELSPWEALDAAIRGRVPSVRDGVLCSKIR